VTRAATRAAPAVSESPVPAAARRVRLLRAPLAGREEVGERTWVLWFEAPEIAAAVQPGEFLMLGFHPPTALAFLKRPFSVCDAVEGRISLLVRAYGPGTALMAQARIGDEFELLGLFGRGFRLEDPAPRVVMVAGGVGLAPFYLLARRLKALPRPPQTLLVYGERTGAALTRELERFPHFDRVLLYTDDGSAGETGNVVDGLRRLAAAGELAGVRLCGCGPRRMLEALEVERERLEIPGEYSLEERMGCGFGICQGCAVPANPARSKRSYHLLCKAGPVMNPELLLWPHQTLP
jgi:dihydroorotate dehydrogenase electron transfer subunit